MPARVVVTILACLLVQMAGTRPARAGGEPTPAGSLATCVRTVGERLQSHYDHVQDFEAHFVQQTHSVAFAGGTGGEQLAQGTVLFAKPGRMRWIYQKPEPSLVVSDGKKLWIYDETAGEVQVMHVGAGFLSGAALHFLFGGGRIEKSFRVEGLRCDETQAHLRLLPRAQASYESLELRVDPASGRVLETTVVDLFGNRTQVRFDDVRENRSPDAALFRFVPPEGARVTEIVPPPSASAP